MDWIGLDWIRLGVLKILHGLLEQIFSTITGDECAVEAQF